MKVIAENSIQKNLLKLRQASRKLIHLNDANIQAILHKVAAKCVEKMEDILAANRLDLEKMEPENPKYDRLLLDKNRLENIAKDLLNVASLPSPLGRILEEKTLPNGLHLRKVSVPIGVLGIVFESRPNVAFDVFSLCLKSGNAVALKGSRDAHHSNLAIVEIIREVLQEFGIEEAIYLAPPEREALPEILHAVDLIDAIIPRGSQALIDFVRANAKVPVIETGAGIVHTYFDQSGDLEKGKSIVTNAKSRRVSVCNALDTLIIHRSRLEDLPNLLKKLGEEHRCEVFADAESFAVLKNHYPTELLFPATESDFGIEFLSMKMSVKTVGNLEEALEHIARYSSRHSEAIVAEDETVVAAFLKNVDAAVVYANVSTAFTDGAQFGMGAEIGISTQKLHARGPMGLPELTSYKWEVRGNGQIRPK